MPNAKPNLHIVRNLRLQLKTGFLQKAPDAYLFLQRYPPLSRDTAPPVRELVPRNIPYLKYYEEALSKNPLYADEHVYPAYWAHEPQALTLAKKQYELVKKGISEEEAYSQALAHVHCLEDVSFEKMKSLLADLKGAKLPYAADKVLSGLIDQWRQRLRDQPYDSLPLAEQGQIDWIVQTKVLKWNEVERERRMKDPIFVLQFETLRSSVFPEIAQADRAARVADHENYKARLLTLYGVSQERLCTAKPFYYEEYAAFFAALKKEPLTGRWSAHERERLSRWIVDTLAIREVVERRTSSAIQRYLDSLRAQFFPMVRFPDRANSLVLPPAAALKALLHAHDVGYKRQEDKLYVRRFYRLPQLLFPQETLASSIVSDEAKLSRLVEDESSLLSEISRAGLDAAALPELQRQLKEYNLQKDAGMTARDGGDMDLSPLDALLMDDETVSAPEAGVEEDGEEADELGGQEEGKKTWDADFVVGSRLGDRKAGAQLRDMSLNNTQSMSRPDWDKLVASYFRPATTGLERQRDELFDSVVLEGPENAEDEVDLYHHKRVRTENEIVARARLSVRYEQKEAARRVAEWKSRGVMLEELPRAQLNVIDRRTS